VEKRGAGPLRGRLARKGRKKGWEDDRVRGKRGCKDSLVPAWWQGGKEVETEGTDETLKKQARRRKIKREMGGMKKKREHGRDPHWWSVAKTSWHATKVWRGRTWNRSYNRCKKGMAKGNWKEIKKTQKKRNGGGGGTAALSKGRMKGFNGWYWRKVGMNTQVKRGSDNKDCENRTNNRNKGNGAQKKKRA